MFAGEVEYLDHIVSAEGLRKPPHNIEKVQAMLRPTTVRGLREFLGLANFQRKFVPNFSAIRKPLNEKNGGRGTRKLKWNHDMIKAFEMLNKQIARDVQLAFPDYGQDACSPELYTDASGLWCGCWSMFCTEAGL
jgi:hypothetical protein